jgi:hypothetical protein
VLLPCAFLALAQSAPPKPVLGTVTEFKVESLQMGVKPDSGRTVWVKFGSETQVVMVAPGELDLAKAQPAKITDIARDDRVMVSYVAGMAEARRIVLISASAIARRDAAERLDWEKRGISGVVAAREDSQITLETRTPQGAQHTIVTITPKTAIRRYAPDSVRFTEAQPSSLNEIAIGDQIRTRGDRSEDGASLTADDVVFGTFLTTLGSITEVNREAGEMKILDSTSKRALTIRLTADTQMKKMPELRDMLFSRPKAGDHPPTTMSEMLQHLPAGAIDDLKVGTSVVVTSTRGALPDRVTGIMVIANVDGLLQMAQSQAGSANPMDALNKMHGGMMGGPGGFSLPAIGQ